MRQQENNSGEKIFCSFHHLALETIIVIVLWLGLYQPHVITTAVVPKAKKVIKKLGVFDVFSVRTGAHHQRK